MESTWIVRIKVNQKFVPEFCLNNLCERIERVIDIPNPNFIKDTWQLESVSEWS